MQARQGIATAASDWSARWWRQFEVAGYDLRPRLHADLETIVGAEDRQLRDRAGQRAVRYRTINPARRHTRAGCLADQSRSRLASRASACRAPRYRELTPWAPGARRSVLPIRLDAGGAGERGRQTAFFWRLTSLLCSNHNNSSQICVRTVKPTNPKASSTCGFMNGPPPTGRQQS